MITEGEKLQEQYVMLKATTEEINQKIRKEQEKQGLFEELEQADGAREDQIIEQLVTIEKKYNSPKINQQKVEVEKQLIQWFLDNMEELQEKEIAVDGVKVSKDIDISELRENLFFPTIRKKLRKLALKTDPRELMQQG